MLQRCCRQLNICAIKQAYTKKLLHLFSSVCAFLNVNSELLYMYPVCNKKEQQSVLLNCQKIYAYHGHTKNIRIALARNKK